MLLLADPDLSTGITQITYSAMVVWLMQRAKNAKWLPWIGDNSTHVNRAVSIVSSAFVAVGVHWTMQGTFIQGSIITIQIPGAMALWMGFLHWFQSFVTQETLYQVVSNKTPTVEWQASQEVTRGLPGGGQQTTKTSVGEKIKLTTPPGPADSLGPVGAGSGPGEHNGDPNG